MDQRYSPFPIEPGDVFTMISTKLRANAAAVLTEARRTGEIPHAAAHRLAQQRVLAAMRLRRMLPPDPGTGLRS
jgi:glutamate dehydrogenase (NAD(P)+)